MRFSCGLIVAPKLFIRSKYRDEVISRTVATLVGSGIGCDEIGYDEDDPIENMKLTGMIESVKNDNAHRERVTKAYELLHKF